MISRRDALGRCIATGLLIAAPPLKSSSLLDLWEQAVAGKRATRPNELGLFYKPQAPHISDLARPGDRGLPLTVSGLVFDTRGTPLPGAVVEIWHADPVGQYDNQGFHYRAQLTAAAQGQYEFHTNMPGHYPDRVTQHIHYKVTAPGHRGLVTQLYFATDPAFEGDPDKKYVKDPILHSRELIRPVTVFADPQLIRASVVFEVVLEPA